MIKTFSLEGRFGDFTKNLYARKIKQGLENGGLVYNPITPDLVICLGGDGSLLKAISNHNYEGTFLLANGGTLGYLSDFLMDDTDSIVDSILHSSPFLELHTPIVIQDGDGKYGFAANEVSLVSPIKAVNFDIYIGSEHLSAVQSSGVVVSTSLGSTAFNLSSGGPILLTGDSNYVLNLLEPLRNRVMSTNFKSVVVPSNVITTLNFEQNYKNYTIACDGIEMRGFESHTLSFYQSKTKRFAIAHYRLRSKIKRIGYAFGKL